MQVEKLAHVRHLLKLPCAILRSPTFGLQPFLMIRNSPTPGSLLKFANNASVHTSYKLTSRLVSPPPTRGARSFSGASSIPPPPPSPFPASLLLSPPLPPPSLLLGTLAASSCCAPTAAAAASASAAPGFFLLLLLSFPVSNFLLFPAAALAAAVGEVAVITLSPRPPWSETAQAGAPLPSGHAMSGEFCKNFQQFWQNEYITEEGGRGADMKN